jgi:hypothetical protein
MNPEIFSLGLRKFLKTVGVGSQREIEQAVAKAMPPERSPALRPSPRR